MLETAFTRLLGCRVPIQQAGMGGIGPEIAVPVAEAGALGMVGVPMVPADQVRVMLEEIGAATAGKVGVNFLMPFLDRDAVKIAAANAPLVEFFYGDPDPSLVEMGHEGGALVSWQIGSVAEAEAAVAAGCDLIAAQGQEAGGHVRGTTGLFALLPAVLEAVDVPVIAAGGIGSPRAMAAALAAGAAAVRVGTRFVAAKESPAHRSYVDALLDAQPEDTVLTTAFSALWPNAPHRVLRSSVDAAQAFTGEIVGELVVGDMRIPLPPLAPQFPTQSTTGAVEAMALYAGESVSEVREVKPAADIIAELAGGAEELLRAW